MNQNPDTTTLLAPARRRPVSAGPVPVLIQIPNLAAPRASGRRTRRRRLRREVRVAGYAMLMVLPMSLAFVSFGNDRIPPRVKPGLTVDRVADAEDRGPAEVPAISISLEPLASAPRDLTAPVFLLPPEPAEEDDDGRH